jgi:hypothetical protein
VAVAVAASSSIPVRFVMNFSRLILPALMLGSPSLTVAQTQPLSFPPSPRVCAAAAQSVRDWGWSDGSDESSVAMIVSAVNRQLRSSDGRLPPADIARLKEGAVSSDACVRELSLGILKTQNRDRGRRPHERLADAAKTAELRNFFASAKVEKSVTRSSEKQSPTREAISP